MFAFIGACDSSTEPLGHIESPDSGRFGPEDQLAATISPGRFVSSTDADGDYELELQAASPTALISLDNGSAAAVTFRLSIRDLITDGALTTELLPVPLGRRQELACSERDESIGSIELDPIVPSVVESAVSELELVLPACSRLYLRPTRSDRAAIWRSLIAPAHSDPGLLAELLAEADIALDHVVFLGGQSSSRGSDPLNVFSNARQLLELPMTWVADPRRGQERSGDVVRRYGPSSLMIEVEDARILILETQHRGATADARALLNTLPSSELRDDIVIFAVPPAIPGVPDRESFNSYSAASMLIEELASRGFGQAITAAGASFSEAEFGPLRWYLTPRTKSDIRDLGRWWVIELRGVHGAGVACDGDGGCAADERCAAGRCRSTCARANNCQPNERCHPSGLCAATCSSDDDCADTNLSCIDNLCAPMPVSRVRRLDELLAE